MNGFHILQPKIVETFYKIRLPYQRKFIDYKTTSGSKAIMIARHKMITEKHNFIEVYRIDVDSNPYYEPIQTLICKLWK